MPFAIDRDCVAAIHADETGCDAIILSSLNERAEHRVTIDDAVRPGIGAAKGSWQSYALGVIAGLGELGSLDALRGCRLTVATDVPLGAGLSSSAALEVSVGVAVAVHCGISIGGLELAKLCQQAEHRFAGVPCGLMDQAIAVLGRARHLVRLDCATDATAEVPLPSDCEMVVINSGVSHALADGEYGKRRAACERAAEALGVEHLAHADPESIGRLAEELQPYARHVVRETARVSDLSEQLEDGDLHECGRLMLESHRSLRDDFRVSCDEIDAIIDAISGAEGVYGARMTGGGFGGCVIAMVRPGLSSEIGGRLERLRDLCPALDILPVQAADGARLLASR